MNDEHSNAFPAVFYGDPAAAYERMESMTCKGCTHELIILLGEEKNISCDKGRQHGNRCKHYREK